MRTTHALGVATALIVTLTGCGAGFGSGGTGGCRVTVDHPHESDGTPGQIVGKARIVCDVPAQDVYLYVKLEREVGGVWGDYAVVRDPAIGAVKVGKRGTRQATDACAPGRFRTAARGEGTLGGQYSGSASWTYSRIVTDPCGK